MALRTQSQEDEQAAGHGGRERWASSPCAVRPDYPCSNLGSSTYILGLNHSGLQFAHLEKEDVTSTFPAGLLGGLNRFLKIFYLGDQQLA